MTTGNNLLSKFFKVYVSSQSGDDLELPISVNSFLQKSLPRSVTVRSIYGNIWKLALRKCGGHDEKYVLVDGWKRIVKDEDLNNGDFLVFEFDGSRCFNFCIYEGRTMCKRLRKSPRQTHEIQLESDVEEESRARDNVIDLSDEDDDDDDNDDSDDADFDYASDDVIDLGDDDDNDNDDSDDGDYDYASDDYADDIEAKDSTAEAVDDDDVEAVDDDDVEAVDVDDDDSKAYDADDRKYLDDPKNPFFKMTLNPKRKSQLRIPAYVIKDYGLNFPESITVVDPLAKKFGKLVKKIKIQANGSVFLKGFGSVIRRNNVKTTDRMIFELKKTGGNLVHTIKLYIISG